MCRMFLRASGDANVVIKDGAHVEVVLIVV